MFDENMWKKINSVTTKYLLSFTIFVLISTPLLSQIINRRAGNYPNDFIGRDYMVSGINNFRYFIMKDRVYEQMITDTMGWFMLADQPSMDDYQRANLFTVNELEIVRNKLSNLCTFTTKNGIDLIFIVPPNKNTIYPEYMPAEITIMNKQSRLDQVVEIWEETDRCKMLDLRDELIEAKSSTQVYYSTDTHWNDSGVFIAHQALIKMLMQKYPSIQMPSEEDYQMTDQEYFGDLIGKNFGQINTSEIATFYTPIGNPGYHLITSIGAWGWEVNDSYNVNTDLPSAIAYRDSFLSSWIPFLAQIFREAHYYWSYKIDPNRIIGEHPDIIIIEFTERALGILTLFPDQPQYDINW
jgi:hypothetical protein